VILINLTDVAANLHEANNRMQQVLLQLRDRAKVDDNIREIQLMPVAGSHDYIVLLEAEPAGAVIAAVAFRQAGPASTETLTKLDDHLMAAVDKVLPRIKKVGPFLPWTEPKTNE